MASVTVRTSLSPPSTTSRYTSVYGDISDHHTAKPNTLDTDLDQPPHALLSERSLALGKRQCAREHVLCRTADELINDLRVQRLLRRETVSLERDFSADGAAGDFPPQEVREGSRPGSAEVYLPWDVILG